MTLCKNPGYYAWHESSRVEKMAGLMLIAGALCIAGGLAYVGIQGLRGVPDSTGKPTSKGVAIVCLVLAAAVLVGAFFGYSLIRGF
jgi:hypothetical protein